MRDRGAGTLGREDDHAFADEELLVVAALVDAVVEIREHEAFGDRFDARRRVDRAGFEVGPANARALLVARDLRGARRHAANTLDVDLAARPAADEDDARRAPAGRGHPRDVDLARLGAELAALERRAQVVAERAVVALRRGGRVVLGDRNDDEIDVGVGERRRR